LFGGPKLGSKIVKLSSVWSPFGYAPPPLIGLKVELEFNPNEGDTIERPLRITPSICTKYWQEGPGLFQPGSGCGRREEFVSQLSVSDGPYEEVIPGVYGLAEKEAEPEVLPVTLAIGLDWLMTVALQVTLGFQDGEVVEVAGLPKNTLIGLALDSTGLLLKPGRFQFCSIVFTKE
jgi:hypothetical protein